MTTLIMFLRPRFWCSGSGNIQSTFTSRVLRALNDVRLLLEFIQETLKKQIIFQINIIYCMFSNHSNIDL